MDGKCNDQNLIYQATTSTSRETYIGLCDTTFKLRYRNHVCSFKNERYQHATDLSKYVWSQKDKNILYNINLRKIKQVRSHSDVTKRWNLCLWERYFIICKPEMPTLNNRSLALPITSPHVTPLGIVLYLQILYIFLCIRYFWRLPDDCSERSMKPSE